LCPTTNPLNTSELFCIAYVHVVYADTSITDSTADGKYAVN
jgi:hypothetical protein